LLPLVTSLLVAITVFQWVRISTLHHRVVEVDPHDVVADHEASLPAEIPVGPDDPSHGPADAPVRLVVFSSFQCPGCRSLAGALAALVAEHPSGLRVVFKHFPLGAACNAGVGTDAHPHACRLSWAAEAARRQGGFWRFHDAVFTAAHPPDSPTDLSGIAAGVGLDGARLLAESGSAAAKSKVEDDVRLGLRLGVDGTPTVFLNGRRVRHLSPRGLRILVEHELAARSGGGGT
jgi:protein-disulfide isomerase